MPKKIVENIEIYEHWKTQNRNPKDPTWTFDDKYIRLTLIFYWMDGQGYALIITIIANIYFALTLCPGTILSTWHILFNQWESPMR